MYDNYNYPEGADTPDAPWNQAEPPEMEFEVTCCQNLSKTVIVTTSNYVPYVDEGFEDGVGYYDEWPDTSDTIWADEYKECGYHTPLQLIELLKEYLQKDLEECKKKDGAEPHRAATIQKIRKLKNLIEECDGWCNDETEFVLE